MDCRGWKWFGKCECVWTQLEVPSVFVDVLMPRVGGLVPSAFVVVYNGKLQLTREMAGTHIFDLPHMSTLFRIPFQFTAFNGSGCNLMVLLTYLRDQIVQ
jgi:hypothetical protein